MVGDGMKIKDLVSDEIKKQLGYKPKQFKKTKRIVNSNLTEYEIKELMGVYRDTYKRYRGAIRRKR